MKDREDLGRSVSKGFSWRIRVLLMTVSALLLLVAITGTALADRWRDISDQRWIDDYQTTADEIATIAEGRTDQSFGPEETATRSHFAKMAVDGLGLTTVAPPTNTFRDVPTNHLFYRWIEGAAARGIISGFPDNTFRGSEPVQRQHANSILGRYLSQQELEATGFIQGTQARYLSLTDWYLAEGGALMTPFADQSLVVADHRHTTAYLIHRGVVKGSENGGVKRLSPTSNLTRAQGAVMVLRVRQMASQQPVNLRFIIAGIPESVFVGAPSSFMVTVVDQNGNIATDYRGTIGFTSTDPDADLPDEYTYTAADAGVHTFTNGVTLWSEGAQSVSVSDKETGAVVASQTVLVMSLSPQPSSPTISVTGLPDPFAAGETSTVVVTVLTPDNKVMTDYVGTVRFSSDDPAAKLPDQYTFTAADAGQRTFTNGVTLKTTGLRRVSATDVNSPAITGSQVVTVTAGPPTKLSIETQADGQGQVVDTRSLQAGQTLTVYAITRDAQNNFIANVAATWSLTNIAGEVAAGDLVPASGNRSATFTAHKPGSAKIQATDGTLTGITGVITVIPGTAAKLSVETQADGKGQAVDARTLPPGQTLTVYAIARDSQNNFLGNVSATWSLTERIGDVVSGDLVPATGNESATFTAHKAGSAKIQAKVGTLTATTGAITVPAGPPTKLSIETQADGQGQVVDTRSLQAGQTLTVYAITRDAQNNFIANVAATWSLTNIAGEVAAGDLVPASGNRSATFTAHKPGSAKIQATDGTLTGITGVITVTAVPPVIISLSPNRGPNTGGTEIVVTGTGFTAPTEVLFAGTAIPSADFTVHSDTKITVHRSPAHAVGAVQVQVRTASGTSAIGTSSQYTYELRQIKGKVEGATPVPLTNGKVKVVLNASDPNYNKTDTSKNFIGQATLDTEGNYVIDVGNLPIGSIVDVSASADGYHSATQYGEYDRAIVVCSFIWFTSPTMSDRRLQYDSGIPSGPPFEGLWPNVNTAP